jgi:flagellar hook-basal body complex protein FliE
VAEPTASLRPVPAGLVSTPAPAPTPRPGGEARTMSFGNLLAQVLTGALDASRKGETQATRAIAGGADLQQVVEAVNAAELTLQTVVAVRDRIIGAYQEIMRMPM